MINSGEPPVEQLKSWFFEEPSSKKMTAAEFWSLCKARHDYVASYLEYWQLSLTMTSNMLPVDGVIMPVLANSACSENDLHYFGRHPHS
jgi:hypothetical protein